MWAVVEAIDKLVQARLGQELGQDWPGLVRKNPQEIQEVISSAKRELADALQAASPVIER